MQSLEIMIPTQTRMKKNSMMVISYGKGGGRYAIKSSKIYTAWEKQALIWLKKQNYPAWSGTYPVEIRFFLFRDSKRKWDIDNVYCGTLDVLQKSKIIRDDSMDHVIPIFSGWAIDKKNPRVVVQITETDHKYFRKDLCVFK